MSSSFQRFLLIITSITYVFCKETQYSCCLERYPCHNTESVVETFIFNSSKPTYNLTIIPLKIKWINPEDQGILIKIYFVGNSSVTQKKGWMWAFSHSQKGLVEGKYINDKSNITIKVEPYFGLVPPFIKSLKVNNIEICENGTVENLWDDCIGLETYESKPLNLTPLTQIPKDKSECGKKIIGHEEYILGGSESKLGDWPWHVSIFRTNTISSPLKYICGGSLITTSRILTAAHCVTTGNAPILPERLFVWLGKFNFIGTNIGEQAKEVFQVIVHPQFDRLTLENDIAVLKLASEAIIDSYVRPICLWEENELGKESLIEKDGQVVGWQWNELEQKKVLSEISVKIKSDVDCIRSNPLFFTKFVTKRTFCAGYVNGSSPCNGDSGGGLFIPNENNKWHIRGIVSLGVSRSDKASCDPKHYTVFTDISEYKDFIGKYS